MDWDATSYYESIASLKEEDPLDIPWDIPTLTKRGVLMADPGTKGTLTLLNLIAEEEAALNAELGEQVRSEWLLDNLTFPVHMHRNISIAGDDHAAIGDPNYLSNIGENHVKNNMVLNVQKHGQSKTGAKYCEEYFLINEETSLSNKDNDYNKSIMVDTLKVALVSPETKQQQEATNPSIGKGAALFKRMGWAPPGWKNFCRKVVRPRFFARHTKYLPKGEKGYDRKVEMPFTLGGLQMGPFHFVEWDPRPALKGLSNRHLKAIQLVLHGDETHGKLGPIKEILSRFSGNRFARGVSQDVTERAERIFKDHISFIPSKPLKEIVPTLVAQGFVKDYQGYRHQTKAAQRAGFVTVKDLTTRIGELETQKQLFMQPPKADMKPATWEKRYERLEQDLKKFGIPEDRPDDQVIAEDLLKFNNVDQLNIRIHERDLYLSSEDLLFEDDEGELCSIPNEILRDRPGLTLPSLLENGLNISMTSSELMSSVGAISAPGN
jgi:hypothetical protein